MNEKDSDVRTFSERLKNKVAIITGSGAGIGEGSAMLLASQGANVVVADIDGSQAQRVADAIVAAGGKAIACTTDVSDEAQVVAMIEDCLAAYGRIDILQNNAAATSRAHILADLKVADIDIANWDRTMQVNLRGPMLCCKFAIPHMITGGGGSIINMSSAKWETGDLITTAYGTSKAGLNALTRYVATQYGKLGVRANAVVVGIVLKGEELVRDGMSTERLRQIESYERQTLTSFLGTPTHIANLVAFLASDESAYLTGAIINADGGFTAHTPLYADMVAKGF